MFESDDDEPAGRQPLPPEDRLWRHPSELGATRPASPPPQPQPRGSFAVAAGSALAGALVVGGAWLAVSGVGTSGNTDTETGPAINTVASAPERDDSWTEPIAAALEPSLPSLKILRDGETSMAAGVVLDSDGHIATSAAAVGEADLILVLGPDGNRTRAYLVGADDLTDIAVVSTERSDLAPAPLALTRRTRVGQYALARSRSGNTSADGRVVAISTTVPGPKGEMLHGVIAYSSPEDPPTPGDGVFDDAGEVFAVTTSATAVSTERMGHAVPVGVVVEIAEQLIEDGAALHPWLGIQGTDLPPESAAALGTSGGALITAVTADGPADDVGVAVDDVVVSANGQKVDSMADLVIVLREAEPGTTIDLHVIRSGAVLRFSPRLGRR